MLSIDLLRPDIISPGMYAELKSWVTNFQSELIQSEKLTEVEIRKMFNRAWPYFIDFYLLLSPLDWSSVLEIEFNAYWYWINIFVKKVVREAPGLRIGEIWIDVANCRITIKNAGRKKKLNPMEYLEV